MTSGAGSLSRRLRRLPVLRWLLPRPKRVSAGAWNGTFSTPPEPANSRRQRRVDKVFWDLVHRHDWLQYDPPNKGKP